MKAKHWFLFVLSLGLLATTAQGEKQLPELQKDGIEIMEIGRASCRERV